LLYRKEVHDILTLLRKGAAAAARLRADILSHADEIAEKRVGAAEPGAELRVELATYHPGVIGQLANRTNYTASYKDILWHKGNQILQNNQEKTFAFLGSMFIEVGL
jgi:hypothetical protein